MNAWLVTSHEEAKIAFDHHDLGLDAYSSMRPSPLPLPSSFELETSANQRLQHAVSSCIGRRTLPVDVVAKGCSELVAAAPLGEPIEFVNQIAEPIAQALVKAWFGFDDRAMTTMLALFAAARSENTQARRTAAAELIVRQLLKAIEARRECPSDDLLSHLSAMWRQHELPDPWLVSFVAPMFASLVRGFGGRLIAHSVLHLMGRPDLQSRIKNDGWDAARAVAFESSRLDPVNQASPRRATRSLSLGGQDIQAADWMWIVLPAVCRDPAVHDMPHEFRLNRGTRHLAFGKGAHVCTGRELALAVAAAALTEILTNRGLSIVPVSGQQPEFFVDFGRACVRLPVILQR